MKGSCETKIEMTHAQGRIDTPQEILIGGCSAVVASVVTNPVDSLRMRMQLINIMRTKGRYSDFYRYHAKRALVNAARNRGISSLQAGLVPTMLFQFIMNGLRLGSYARLEEQAMFVDEEGRLLPHLSVLFNGLTTAVGTSIASPFYTAKIKLQKQAAAKALTGRTERYNGTASVLYAIYLKTGFPGLFQGALATVPIVTLGSTVQLLTFSLAKQKLDEYEEIATNGAVMAFLAAVLAGLTTTVVMTPFDVIQSRFIIQPHSATGEGLVFRNYREVAYKVMHREGLRGFYAGTSLSYLKIGPQTLLTLFLWDVVRFSGFSND